MRRLRANAVGCVLLLLTFTAHAGDMKPMRSGPRNQNADGNVLVTYDRDGKEKFGPGITMTIKGAEREGVPMLHISEALYFVDAQLDNKAKQLAVVFVDGVSVVYRRYHVNAGRWESDIGGALMEYDLRLQKSSRMELTDMNTFRATFSRDGKLVGSEKDESAGRVRIAIVDAEGNLIVDGTKVGLLKGKKIIDPSEGTSSVAETNRVMEGASVARQDENDARVKKLISSMCRRGSDEDVAEALTVLKDGAGGAVDDLAMLTLYVMKSRVIGLNTGEWNSLIASNYYECVSHLKRVRLERSTVTQWKDYPQQTAFALELTGGDKMMSLVIRGKWLVELDQYVQRVKRATGGDASEVDAFVKKEAKAILAEWPNANLRDTMRVLSGEITAKDLDQEMEQKRKVADQQRDTF